MTSGGWRVWDDSVFALGKPSGTVGIPVPPRPTPPEDDDHEGDEGGEDDEGDQAG